MLRGGLVMLMMIKVLFHRQNKTKQNHLTDKQQTNKQNIPKTITTRVSAFQ